VIIQSRLGNWFSRLPFDFKPRPCAAGDSEHRCRQPIGQYFRKHSDGIWFQSQWYCSAGCFERGVLKHLRRLSAVPERPHVSHRMPVGLVLLSQGCITKSQLAAALSAQREAGQGRVGDWLRKMGAAGEHEITKALSEQWRCPVLKSGLSDLAVAESLPYVLLERHRVLPVHYVTATRTMYLAFSDGVAYPVLTAVEQMLECRTEACLITPTSMDFHLDQLRASLPDREIVFERLQSNAEVASIVRSYASHCRAKRVRMAGSGVYTWVRLFADGNIDLLFRSAPGPSYQGTFLSGRERTAVPELRNQTGC
jgi:hypothetical protein